jgi:hypothetical protein
MTLDVAVVIAQPHELAKLGHKSLQIVVPCKDCKNPTTEGYERME